MSPDVVGMIIALFAFTVTVIGGVVGALAHFARRLDDRFDRVDGRLDRMDDRLDRMDDRLDRMDDRIRRVSDELVEVKVAIARLEGPRPRLQQI